ncbi:hypothetical protein VP1G_11226 [Cytospora mali]|uniref:Uncharacterized protein n=1 Tax=Cytospora mali TaxID=578113 RepID=A0A194V9F0_CYTMA|nr:hypothetical protein VP1G_11226 [Valsa mali var. pyri (nom. inval.)]
MEPKASKTRAYKPEILNSLVIRATPEQSLKTLGSFLWSAKLDRTEALRGSAIPRDFNTWKGTHF